MNKKILLYTKAFSDLGTMMDMIIMNAVIYMMTGSSTWLSIVLGARVLGGVLSSLFAGVWADRFDRRRLMISSDLLRGGTLLLLVFYPTPYMFLLVSFLLGFFATFFQVSFSAEIPQIFGQDKVLEVNSLISRLSSISMVGGFLGGAILSTMIDYTYVLALDALSFFVCAWVLAKMNWSQEQRFRAPTAAEPTAAKPKVHTITDICINAVKRWYRDIQEVKSYLLLRPILLIIFVVLLVQTFGASSHNVGIPILAATIDLESATFYQGLIWGVWAIGNVLTTLCLPHLGWIKRKMEMTYLYASLLLSISFILLLSNISLWLVLPIAFITGVFDGCVITLNSTILQKSDNHIRGRVFGVSALINRLGFTAGFVATAILLKIISMPHMVWILHGCVILGIIVALGKIYFNQVAKKQVHVEV